VPACADDPYAPNDETERMEHIVKLRMGNDEGLTRQCPRLRTWDWGKRASDELEGRDSDKQGEN
jgi:hypothetical protein